MPVNNCSKPTAINYRWNNATGEVQAVTNSASPLKRRERREFKNHLTASLGERFAANVTIKQSSALNATLKQKFFSFLSRKTATVLQRSVFNLTGCVLLNTLANKQLDWTACLLHGLCTGLLTSVSTDFVAERFTQLQQQLGMRGDALRVTGDVSHQVFCSAITSNFLSLGLELPTLTLGEACSSAFLGTHAAQFSASIQGLLRP